MSKKAKHVTVNTYQHENKVYTVIKTSIGNTFRGVAKCDGRDEFNIEFGTRLSEARAKIKRLKALINKRESNLEKLPKERDAVMAQYNSRIEKEQKGLAYLTNKLIATENEIKELLHQ